MAKRNNIMISEAREQLDQLKEQVVQANKAENSSFPKDKYEVASELGIPLTKNYNGTLTSKEAGKIGGPIGGPIGGQMVKEMVRMAQEQLKDK